MCRNTCRWSPTRSSRARTSCARRPAACRAATSRTPLDGMTMFITVANAMEQFQQIEVVNGCRPLAVRPGQSVRHVQLRLQAADRLRPARSLTASYNSDSIGTGKVDLGGRIDSSGIFSYRFNALYGAGDGYVDHSHQTPRARRSGHRHASLGARRARAQLQRLLARRQGLSGLVHLQREDHPAAGARIRRASATGSPTRASTCAPASPSARLKQDFSLATGTWWPASSVRTPRATSIRRSTT